jgi:hypothetical protein
MAKAPRTEIVGGVGFPREEREEIEEMARRMGNASLSDCVRSATKMYAKRGVNPRRFSEYLAPLLVGSASSGCFLQGIRIEKATRQAVLGWYRLPQTRFIKLVELRGVEPLTPRLPALCSPN